MCKAKNAPDVPDHRMMRTVADVLAVMSIDESATSSAKLKRLFLPIFNRRFPPRFDLPQQPLDSLSANTETFSNQVGGQLVDLE